MRFFQKVKDGGPDSPVDAYVLVEIKSLFSIMLLRFGSGVREAFHSHAFNALTFWLTDSPIEEVFRGGTSRIYERWSWKYTPRDLIHRYVLGDGNWALTFRGPWHDTWQEVKPINSGDFFWEITTLKSPGRQLINRDYI